MGIPYTGQTSLEQKVFRALPLSPAIPELGPTGSWGWDGPSVQGCQRQEPEWALGTSTPNPRWGAPVSFWGGCQCLKGSGQQKLGGLVLSLGFPMWVSRGLRWAEQCLSPLCSSGSSTMPSHYLSSPATRNAENGRYGVCVCVCVFCGVCVERVCALVGGFLRKVGAAWGEFLPQLPLPPCLPCRALQSRARYNWGLGDRGRECGRPGSPSVV